MGVHRTVAAIRSGAWLWLLATACPGSLDNAALFLSDGAVQAGPDTGTADAGDPAACAYVVPQILSSSTSCAQAGCHSASSQQSGLDLESPDLVQRLGGMPASALCSGEVLVDLDNPANSLIYTKLTPARPCGGRMPPIGQALTDNEVQCVLVWLQGEIQGPADAGQPANDAGAPGLLQYFEAEDAASLRQPYTVQTDTGASEEEYILLDLNGASGMVNNTPGNPEAGLVTFTFTLGQAGVTQFWIRVRAVDSSSDSFWVRLDQGEWFRYNNIPQSTTVFLWDDIHDSSDPMMDVPWMPTLDAGLHTLDLMYREPAQLDQLLVSQDTAFVPSN